MINWLWKDKQERVPLTVTQTSQIVTEETTVRVSLEFKIKHPITTDVIETIKKTEAKFNLPNNAQILSADIVRIEII
jgi:hypothetical protein